ncbi:MAG: MogA/MoaB family molybdenum cofactor biosynthesis protein [Deltaproteobacteria bacterium]|nr:MogA/MoaB family molybdenum cofactor biosynthesis protein [Deltaproteobacteria bacterium]
MSKNDEHHQHDATPACCLVVTVSDSRTLETDVGGAAVAAGLERHGHRVLARRLVKDEVAAIRAAVLAGIEDERVDAVVLTGGTGISPRDVTPEALQPMLDRHLPGFGELFRQLSFAAAGPVALLSRALAGVVGTTLVFALPGSPSACSLGTEQLIAPVLGHAVVMLDPPRGGVAPGARDRK